MDGENELGQQVEMVGRAFVDHYYHLFDNSRSSLVALYQPSSLLTFEGQKIQGATDIAERLCQLPFDQCKHSVSTIDSQPSSIAGGILVFVSGNLHLPGEEHPLRFSQFKHRIWSVAVDGADVFAATEVAWQSALARFESRLAAEREAAKREEARVADLKRLRGEKWLPSMAKQMQMTSS